MITSFLSHAFIGDKHRHELHFTCIKIDVKNPQPT